MEETKIKEKAQFKVSKGFPVLGTSIDRGGVNFGVFTRNGTSVNLEIY